MSSEQPPSNKPTPPQEAPASTKPAKPVKRPKRPDPADYPPLPPMLELTGNAPIPPASEPLQYRAIGLVFGKYLPSAEEFNQGTIVADDGTLVDSAILGRVVSLIKNHIDLNKSHLWVVYPRSRKEDNKLHTQIMGIWEPELALRPIEAETKPPVVDEPDKIPSVETIGIPINYFSIRGEVIYQSRETKEIFVKIRQAPKKKNEEERYFKIRLVGDLPQKLVGNFWDFDVLREGDDLILRSGRAVASLRAKPPKREGGGRPPFKGGDRGDRAERGDRPERIDRKPSFDKPTGDGSSKPIMPVKPKPIERTLPRKLDLPE
jgi:hypothetical protein